MLLCCVLVMQPHIAQAASPAAPLQQSQTFERYVEPAPFGDDSNNCTRSIDDQGTADTSDDVYVYSACATISHALAVANSGDIIRVAALPVIGSTYSENLVIKKNITIVGGYTLGFGNVIDPPTDPVQNPTRINGHGAGSTIVVQGSIQVPVNPSLLNLPPIEVKITGIQITGGATGNGGGVSIYSYSNPSTFPFPTYPLPVDVTLDQMSISGNSASNVGGGLYISGNDNNLTVTHSKFDSNTAANGGGGVYIGDNSTVTIKDDSEFSGNRAISNGGGGLQASGSLTVTLSGITLTNNSGVTGGALYASNSLVSLNQSSVVNGNRATNGGGIALNCSACTLSGVTLNQNQATGNGGALFVGGGVPTLKNLELTLNTATNGGGIFTQNSSFTLGNSDVFTNTATSGNGGGVYIQSSSLVTLTTLTVQGNVAGNGSGGGIYVSGANPIAVPATPYKITAPSLVGASMPPTAKFTSKATILSAIRRFRAAASILTIATTLRPAAKRLSAIRQLLPEAAFT